MFSDTSCNAVTALESPFRKHFNTNYVPTDAEIERIRTQLVPHEAELARLEALIRELTTQRDHVKNYIEPHRALISHPRRLPQDILEEIFLRCLPTHHNAVMSATEAPLLLGRICSAWRSVAFAMPRLWASLHIPLAFVTRSESMTAAMVEWLERSAPLPLALSITGGWDDPDNEAVLNLLLGVCHRWGELHVLGMGPLDFSLLAEVHAPLLAEIRIAFTEGFVEATGGGILSSSLFRSMKTARITISGDYLDTLIPSTPFTWDHLTHLTLRWSDRAGYHLSSHSVYRLLEGCKNLTSANLSLSLRPSSWDIPEPWSEESLVLQSLEALTIDTVIVSSPSHDLTNLLNHLIMPRLRQFHMPNSSIKLPDTDKGFIKHLAKHSPTISSLYVGLWSFTRSSLLETLQLFPALTMLSLWYSTPAFGGPESAQQNAAELLATFNPDSTVTHNPLPTLRELTIIGDGWLEEKIWVSFVEKHLESGAGLRRFYLFLWVAPPAAPYDITPFRARGLEVSVTYCVSSQKQNGRWEGIEP